MIIMIIIRWWKVKVYWLGRKKEIYILRTLIRLSNYKVDFLFQDEIIKNFFSLFSFIIVIFCFHLDLYINGYHGDFHLRKAENLMETLKKWLEFLSLSLFQCSRIYSCVDMMMIRQLFIAIMMIIREQRTDSG